MASSTVTRAPPRLVRSLRRLLCVPHIRAAIGFVRYLYFVKLRKRLRTIDSPNAYPLTVGHNLGAFKRIFFDLLTDRVDQLLRPLSAVEVLGPESRTLVIGPRTESDLLLMRGYGFTPANIEAIDLISYSPWVRLGDMHAIPHPENGFDAIVCGWVLAYSNDPIKAASEMIRVARDGALIAIGFDHSLMTAQESEQKIGYAIVPEGSAARINSVQGVLDLFGKHVGTVYFSHDAPMKAQLDRLQARGIYSNSVVMAVFSIRK